MRRTTRQALVARSIPSELIERIDNLGHTVAVLQAMSEAALRQHYSEADAALLHRKLRRTPISPQIVERIVAASAGVCAYCADGNSTRPYQLHHVEPYAATQDNSEENLLLVCPTHHVKIHHTNDSYDAQKESRRRWCATATLAREYASRGIPFAYNVFEPLDYQGRPNVLEVLSTKPVSPATSVELAGASLGPEAVRTATEERFLLIVGGSGSGKSTLAMGVAGLLHPHSQRVFRYRRQPDDTRGALVEVLLFVGTAEVPAVLIVDDANAWATAADLERMASAAESSAVIIICTWTGGRLGDDPMAELHLLRNRVVLDWNSLRPAVEALLLRNEAAVVNRLATGRQDGIERLGFGPVDRSLASLIQTYGSTARSVWQFLYLLGGGANQVGDELNILVADDRADAPAVYAALEQLADFERPVSPEEAAEAAVEALGPAAQPSPDASWTKEVFDDLVQRRLFVNVRGAYTTVHREWASALASRALGDSRAREAATRILDRDLDAHTSVPRRLARLWSWFRLDPVVGPMIMAWAREQRPQDWTALVGTAACAGLADVAMVARRLHLLFGHDHWRTIAGDALETHETRIAELVAAAGPDDWYVLRELFMALNYARPGAAARIITAWSPSVAAAAIGRTHPDHYDSMTWLLSGLREHSADWCDCVGRHVDEAQFESRLVDVRRGHADTIVAYTEVRSRIGLPLLRSTVAAVADAMGRTLRNASLSELYFGIRLTRAFWLELFPEEMMTVVADVDGRRLASQLTAASPRLWGRLIALSGFARRAGVDFAENMVEALGEQLWSTVAETCRANPYELRLLLWQLAYGSGPTRRSIAAHVYSSVEAACRSSETERPTLLTAYLALDVDQARRLAADQGWQLPEQVSLRDLDAPLLDRLPSGPAIRRRLQELDRAGDDYDVGALLFGTQEPESEPHAQLSRAD